MKELKKKIDNKQEINEVYEDIKSSGNKKAKKVMGRQFDKINKEARKIYEEAINSKEMETVSYNSRNKDALHIGKGSKDKITDGFYVGDLDDNLGEEVSYKEVFKTAFYNERFKKIVREEKEQKVPNSYVKDEMEEIDDLKNYWESEDFKNHVKRLEEENPKEAQKYKKAQIKKREALNQLIELYQEIDLNRASLDKISKALQKLESSKASLPANVYKKCKKSLESQQKKQIKQNDRLEKQKSDQLDKTGLRQSINNAKQYKIVSNELGAIPKEQILYNDLKKMKEELIEKKARLPEEEEYKIASNATKLEIEELEVKISKQQAEIKKQEGKKEKLEDQKNSIHAREIRETIQGEKAKPLTLDKGEEEKTTSTGNGDFVPKQEIDHKKAKEASYTNDLNVTKEKDGRG